MIPKSARSIVRVDDGEDLDAGAGAGREREEAVHHRQLGCADRLRRVEPGDHEPGEVPLRGRHIQTLEFADLDAEGERGARLGDDRELGGIARDGNPVRVGERGSRRERESGEDQNR